MGVDDFIARTEVALCYFGFTGDNTIGELLELQQLKRMLISSRLQCAAAGFTVSGQHWGYELVLWGRTAAATARGSGNTIKPPQID